MCKCHSTNTDIPCKTISVYTSILNFVVTNIVMTATQGSRYAAFASIQCLLHSTNCVECETVLFIKCENSES